VGHHWMSHVAYAWVVSRIKKSWHTEVMLHKSSMHNTWSHMNDAWHMHMSHVKDDWVMSHKGDSPPGKSALQGGKDS